MEINKNLFILAGNGSYANRGCEAIVRGTVELIKQKFKAPNFYACSYYSNNNEYVEQSRNERDASIIHGQMHVPRKYSAQWGMRKIYQYVSPYQAQRIVWKDILPYLPQSKVVLSVGGDNYSLDYGIPRIFTDLDDLILKHKKKLIIWGASVGPFDKNRSYEKVMIEHLKKIIIFARESETIDYLNSKGLKDNVFRMADPAFCMKPEKPNLDQEIGEGAVGLNLSPLMAKYVCNGSIKVWIEKAARIIEHIANEIKRPLYLIPHVTSTHSDDYDFLKNVLSLVTGKEKDNIKLISPMFNASEIKWIISKMDVFAGARTHSTIAALSCCIPTITLSYSIKSKGINKDVFGHCDYCIDADALEPEAIVELFQVILNKKDKIRQSIELKKNILIECLYQGMEHLKQII